MQTVKALEVYLPLNVQHMSKGLSLLCADKSMWLSKQNEYKQDNLSLIHI